MQYFRFFTTILALSAPLLFSGCLKTTEPPVGVPLDYRQDFVIPAGIGPLISHHFYFKNIPARYLDYLAQSNVKPEEVTRVLLNSAVLTGINGDEEYSFIESVEMRIYDERNPSDAVEIAYRLPVPLDPGFQLPLIPNEVDVKRFLSSNRFSIDLELMLRKTTQIDSPTSLSLRFTAVY